jgi:outer membrane lipoprotein
MPFLFSFLVGVKNPPTRVTQRSSAELLAPHSLRFPHAIIPISIARTCPQSERPFMIGNRTVLALFIFAFLPGVASATGISRQLLDEAGIPVLFEDLVSFPREYRGRVVVLGGYILEMQNEPGGSILTILQAPLDWRNKLKSPDLSQGRFFITTKKFLDPEVYVKDRRLTVGGLVIGAREQSVGEGTYRFPTIEAQELQLWPEQIYPTGSCYPCYGPWYDPWSPWGYSLSWGYLWWDGHHHCHRHHHH